MFTGASPDLIQIPKDQMIREDGNSVSDNQRVTRSASGGGMCDPHTYRNLPATAHPFWAYPPDNIYSGDPVESSMQRTT